MDDHVTLTITYFYTFKIRNLKKKYIPIQKIHQFIEFDLKKA